jgi:hypothetical protein
MEHHSLLFFIVFVAIILYVAIQQNLMLPVAATFGGFCGSTIQKPHYYKNVLIVDVANMFTGWYMEKYCKKKVWSAVPTIINIFPSTTQPMVLIMSSKTLDIHTQLGKRHMTLTCQSFPKMIGIYVIILSTSTKML